MVLARRDGALLGPLGLVREHVRLKILEGLAAVRVGAPLLLSRLVAAEQLLAGEVGLVRHEASAALGVDGRLERRVGLVITIMHKRGGAAGPELRRGRNGEGGRSGVPGVGRRRVGRLIGHRHGPDVWVDERGICGHGGAC